MVKLITATPGKKESEMTVPRKCPAPVLSWLRQPHQRDAFTLVEIMIVVAIIGLLAALAVPSFVKARTKSQHTAYMEDLRMIEDAVQQYAIDYGEYPADQDAGIMPPELASYLPTMDWSKPTPIGGHWDYCGNVWGITSGIGVDGSGRTADEMTVIDAQIDDGNLATGHFQNSNGQYIDIIEQ